MCADESNNESFRSAEVLYGLIHARFIISGAGLLAMVKSLLVGMFFVVSCRDCLSVYLTDCWRCLCVCVCVVSVHICLFGKALAVRV